MQTERYSHWAAPEAPVFAVRVVAAFCRVAGAAELIDRFGLRDGELTDLTAEVERAWGQPWFYDDIRLYWDAALASRLVSLPPLQDVLCDLRERRIGRNMNPPAMGNLPPLASRPSSRSRAPENGSISPSPERG